MRLAPAGERVRATPSCCAVCRGQRDRHGGSWRSAKAFGHRFVRARASLACDRANSGCRSSAKTCSSNGKSIATSSTVSRPGTQASAAGLSGRLGCTPPRAWASARAAARRSPANAATGPSASWTSRNSSSNRMPVRSRVATQSGNNPTLGISPPSWATIDRRH